MKMHYFLLIALAVVGVSTCSGQDASTQPATATTQADPAVAEVRASSDKLAAAFNAGKVDELTTMFLAKGEVIDESGVVYAGSQEIKEVFTALFTRFPATKLTRDIEAIRVAGPIAIEEGTRVMKTNDDAASTSLRYVAVWSKTETGWRLASHRDFANDAPPTNNDRLQSIAWMEGDWINEGFDGVVMISFKWSEDKNYLLGEFNVGSKEGAARKSSQRIGWDPNAGKIRSWLFDADGGFSEATWNVLEESVIIKSNSVNPDGSTSSATITLTPTSENAFTFAGSQRIVADNLEPDSSITVVRRLPTSAKSPTPAQPEKTK